MAISKKITILSATVLITIGIVGNIAYSAGEQHIDDTIITQLDAQKGRNINGFVIDWAERTQQDGRITLRNLTGHYNGTLVLSTDGTDIVRSGLSIQAVGHNLTVTSGNSTVQTATITIDGLEQAGLNTLLSTPPADAVAALALLNGISLGADGIQITEHAGAQPVTIRHAETNLADGRIGRLQMQDFASSSSSNGQVSIGAFTLENLPVERFTTLQQFSSRTAREFMALMDGTTVKTENFTVRNHNVTTTIASMQNGFAGPHLRDVQIRGLVSTDPDTAPKPAKIGTISIDRIDIVAIENVTLGSINSMEAVATHFDIGRIEMQDTDLAGIVRFNSGLLTIQDSVWTLRIKDTVIDSSAIPDLARRDPPIPQFNIPELAMNQRHGTDTLVGDITLPVQNMVNWQSYYSLANLRLTDNGLNVPNTATPGTVTLNLRLEDRGLIDMLALHNAMNRQQMALTGQMTAMMLIRRGKAEDTIDLPSRIAAFLNKGDTLDVGINLAINPVNPLGAPQIRLVTPERLTLN